MAGLGSSTGIALSTIHAVMRRISTMWSSRLAQGDHIGRTRIRTRKFGRHREGSAMCRDNARDVH